MIKIETFKKIQALIVSKYVSLQSTVSRKHWPGLASWKVAWCMEHFNRHKPSSRNLSWGFFNLHNFHFLLCKCIKRNVMNAQYKMLIVRKPEYLERMRNVRNFLAYYSWKVPKITQPSTRLNLVNIICCGMRINIYKDF